jgi:hypothetical protein
MSLPVRLHYLKQVSIHQTFDWRQYCIHAISFFLHRSNRFVHLEFDFSFCISRSNPLATRLSWLMAWMSVISTHFNCEMWTNYYVLICLAYMHAWQKCCATFGSIIPPPNYKCTNVNCWLNAECCCFQIVDIILLLFPIFLVFGDLLLCMIVSCSCCYCSFMLASFLIHEKPSLFISMSFMSIK